MGQWDRHALLQGGRNFRPPGKQAGHCSGKQRHPGQCHTWGETRAYVHTDTRTLSTALLMLTEQQKTPKHLSNGKWKNKIHRTDCFSVIKTNDTSTHSLTWMKLGRMVLSPRRQLQKTTCYVTHSLEGSSVGDQHRHVPEEWMGRAEGTGAVAEGYAVSFWVDGHVLKLTVVMVAHVCEYTKKHRLTLNSGFCSEYIVSL